MSPSPPSAPSYSNESSYWSIAPNLMVAMAIGFLCWAIPHACIRILEYLVNPTADPYLPGVLASNPNPNPAVLLASNVVPDSPVLASNPNPNPAVLLASNVVPDSPVLASNPNPNPNPAVLASNVVPDSPAASNRIPPLVVLTTYQHDLERGGLDPATISSYPRFPYSASRGGDDDVCSICLSDYTEGEMLRMMPCKHSFHLLCIDEWLRLKASCPLCRAS